MQKKLLALSSTLLLSTLLSAASLSEKKEGLSLVLYESNMALVHELKDLTLYKDERSILYENPPKSVVSQTIRLLLPHKIEIQSHQFRYDRVSQERLLEAHLGKKVQVRRLKSAYEYEIITATLLGYNQSEATVETIGHQILSTKNSSIIFESIPREFSLQPSILWQISTDEDIQTEAIVEYIINEISFHTHYALYLDGDSSELIGSVSLENQTGASFENADVSLLTGEPNRAKQMPSPYPVHRNMTLASSAVESKHNSFEGYHLYEIPFKVSLKDGEKKQIELLNQKKIPTQKLLIAQLSNPLYLQGEQKSEAAQYLLLKGLKQRLPKGLLRTYSKYEGKNIFLGESEIESTPKTEDLKILLGKESDISITQTSIKRQVTKELISSEILYTLTNSSKEAKELTLLIAFNNSSDSKVQTKRDYSYTKGNFVTFKVHLPAEASEKFSVEFESKK